jgi:hypothetical protein
MTRSERGKARQPESLKVLNATDVVMAKTNHDLFTKLFVHALLCNQTKIVNMNYSNSGSTLRMKGVAQFHHSLSHEEGIDDKLGCQPMCLRFYQSHGSSQYCRRGSSRWSTVSAGRGNPAMRIKYAH